MVELKYPVKASQKGLISGVGEQNLKALEDKYTVQIISRGEDFLIKSEEEANIQDTVKTLDRIRFSILEGNEITPYYFNSILNEGQQDNNSFLAAPILRNKLGQPIQPQTPGQLSIIESIQKYDVTFIDGPAGTGKTFLAVAMAVKALEDRQVDKLVLVRPAVEAGENLGFLPGDLQEKIAPYLMPIYDFLQELLPEKKLLEYNEKKQIEIVPLAYMRGRTLKRSFVILDEAQNTTGHQMKMFLTRLGFNSKFVITGDASQTDLSRNQVSGFSHALRVLHNIKAISKITLGAEDVMRHGLVREIITAYEKHES